MPSFEGARVQESRCGGVCHVKTAGQSHSVDQIKGRTSGRVFGTEKPRKQINRKTDQREDKPTTYSSHNRKRQPTQRNKHEGQILYRCAKCLYAVFL